MPPTRPGSVMLQRGMCLSSNPEFASQRSFEGE
jgi:hypothetical protein